MSISHSSPTSDAAPAKCTDNARTTCRAIGAGANASRFESVIAEPGGRFDDGGGASKAGGGVADIANVGAGGESSGSALALVATAMPAAITGILADWAAQKLVPRRPNSEAAAPSRAAA